MDNCELKRAVTVYNFFGKGLFACAIAIMGFMLGGLLLATLGLLAGIIGGNLLERKLLKLIKNNQYN